MDRGMAEPADPLIDVLAGMHRALVAPEELKVTMERLVGLTPAAVPGSDQASITEASATPSTVAHIGNDALAIDDAQYDGGGPCLHAYEHREVVVIGSFASKRGVMG